MDGLTHLNRNLKYKAHRVKVFEDVLETPEGDKVYYDFVENRNGSGILLVDDEGKLLFVKQYRNALRRMDIEIPAGCVEEKDFDSDNKNKILLRDSRDIYEREDFENSENPFYKCAIREAEEETGMIPGKLHFINYIIAAAGLFSERTAVYIGTKLKRGRVNLDPDEYIDIIRMTPDEAIENIRSGNICDSKTIIAVFAYFTTLLH